MSIFQIMYSLYLHILASPLICLLFLLGWKRKIISLNLAQMNLPQPWFFPLLLYRNAVLDLLKIGHLKIGLYIYSRRRDQKKLLRLASGPSLFLSAHFHNWELMGSWLIQEKGIPLLSMAMPFQNAWSNRLLKKVRQGLAIPYLDHHVPRRALRHLRSGKSFGMLWDQHSPFIQDRSSFFDLDVCVDPLPGFLIRQSCAPVFFGALLPSGEFRLIQIFHPKSLPIPPTILSSARLSRRYHRVLEILIRRHPAFYYGLTHRRFKGLLPY